MSQKKTHKQFVEQFELVNKNIILLGKYKDAITKIPVKCKICGYEWLALPNSLLSGRGCRKCAGTLKKTQDEFVSELTEINKTIEVIGTYKNNRTGILVRCKNCNYEWKAVPYNLLKGSGCPKCVGNIRKTHEEFIRELFAYNQDIEVIGQYVSVITPIQVKCKRCGNIWKTIPNRLLSGNGCPKCNHTPTSFMEQFIFAALRYVLGSNEVIHRDNASIGMELDVFIPAYKLAIEPGAWHWHKGRVERDKEKIEACKKAGIDIIIIYDAFNGNEFEFDSNYLLFKQDLGIEKDHLGLKQIVSNILSRLEIQYVFSDKEWKQITTYAYNHSKRMTTSEFIEKLSIISPNLVVLGEYENARISIPIRCKKCGYEWKTSPMNLLRGSGCPRCARTKKKTQEEFVAELTNINSNIKVIGKYDGDGKKLGVRCKVCGYEWNALPSNLLRNEGCPKCAGNLKKTHRQFVEELSIKNPSVEVLGQYVNSHTKIRVKCLICDNIWDTLPVSLLRGLGCPSCAIKKRSEARRKTHQQFLSELAKINPDVLVLQEYRESKTKLSLKCKICNYEWKATPSKLLCGQGCPNCAGTMKKTQETFCNEMLVANPGLEVLGTYINNKTGILVKCKNCGYEWEGNPRSLLKGQLCKACKNGLT